MVKGFKRDGTPRKKNRPRVDSVNAINDDNLQFNTATISELKGLGYGKQKAEFAGIVNEKLKSIDFTSFSDKDVTTLKWAHGQWHHVVGNRMTPLSDLED